MQADSYTKGSGAAIKRVFAGLSPALMLCASIGSTANPVGQPVDEAVANRIPQFYSGAPRAADNRYIVTFRSASLASASSAGDGSVAPALKQLSRRTRATDQMMSQASAAVTTQGGAVRHELPMLNAVAAELAPEARAALAQRPDVLSVEVDPPRYLLAQEVPYGTALVQANLLSYGPAPGIKVCVVDSGFDLGHPDLPPDSRVTGESAPGVGPWFEDGSGHGTHVAGSLMALNNTTGVVGTTNGGDFPVHIYRIFNDEAEPVNSSDVIAGVQACADQGARVVNLSLGCSGNDCFSVAEQSAFAAFEDAGLLVVAAAGNDGQNAALGDQPSFPAGYPSVIAVGAVDEARQHAGFLPAVLPGRARGPRCCGALYRTPRHRVRRRDCGCAARLLNKRARRFAHRRCQWHARGLRPRRQHLYERGRPDLPDRAGHIFVYRQGA